MHCESHIFVSDVFDNAALQEIVCGPQQIQWWTPIQLFFFSAHLVSSIANLYEKAESVTYHKINMPCKDVTVRGYVTEPPDLSSNASMAC